MRLIDPQPTSAFDATEYATPEDPVLDAVDDGPDGLEEATAAVLAAIAERVEANVRPERRTYPSGLMHDDTGDTVGDKEQGGTISETANVFDEFDDFAAGVLMDNAASDDVASTEFEFADQDSLPGDGKSGDGNPGEGKSNARRNRNSRSSDSRSRNQHRGRDDQQRAVDHRKRDASRSEEEFDDPGGVGEGLDDLAGDANDASAGGEMAGETGEGKPRRRRRRRRSRGGSGAPTGANQDSVATDDSGSSSPLGKVSSDPTSSHAAVTGDAVSGGVSDESPAERRSRRNRRPRRRRGPGSGGGERSGADSGMDSGGSANGGPGSRDGGNT